MESNFVSARRVGIVLIAAASVIAAGCTETGEAETSTSSAPAPTPSTPASSAPDSTIFPEDLSLPGSDTTTTEPGEPLAVFDSPSKAGEALFGAWTHSDRAAAGLLKLAPAAELDKLFAAPPLPAAKNRGCDSGEFGVATCFFGNDQGGVDVVLGPARNGGGWTIESIDPFE